MPPVTSESNLNALKLFRLVSAISNLSTKEDSSSSANENEKEDQEPLRSLKPYILNNWISLLSDWMRDYSIPLEALDYLNLGRALDNIFQIMDYLCEDRDTTEIMPLLNAGNLQMSEAINCKLHGPLCLALFETCLEAFQTAILTYHPLKVNGRNMDERKLESLIKLSARSMIHMEMDTCDRRCQGIKCPYAHDYNKSLGKQKR